MKKILFSLGVMLSAFALTNCTQEIENPAQQPELAGYPFEIVASTVDTKTVNDGMSTKWVDGDKINLFHAVTDSTDYKNNGAFTVKDVEAGSFTGNLIETLDVEEEYDWFAFYPYSSYIKTPANTQNGYMPVGSKSSEVQTQTGNNNMTHIAGENYPIAGRAIAVPASSTPSIKMTHVTSLVEVVVTNKTQNPLTVNEIMFVAPEDIIGTFYIDFSGDACSFISSGPGYTSSTATLKVNDAETLAQGQSAKFYLAVKPFKMTGTEGSSLSVYVNGYQKELNINKAISFLPGKIKTLNVAYDKVEEAGIEEATLTFDDKAKRVEYSTSIQVWKENGITVTNNKASSTTNVGDYYKPARFYKNSEVVISAPGMIKEIIINCAGMESKYVTPWGGNEENGIVTMSLDGTSESVKYVMSSGQARANSVTVRYLPTSGGETPEPEPEYTLDGKQWLLNSMDTNVLIDLGLYEEDAMVIALPLMDGTGFGVYMYGTYEIVKTNATSGKIVFTQYDSEWDEFMDPVEYPYSELSENSVKISAESVTGTADALAFAAVAEPYEIEFESAGGGPSGPIENGEYWFFNGEKVMAPLAEGVTTGTLPAGNVISGASTEKNIFTLTYDPDWSYYTIQDSYGRYLGQTDETGNITVTDVLPTDDTYAFYLWCVETGYGDACSIYNAAYYYDITYSAATNNWVLVDGGYEFPETLPILVKAENPVEEPVVPQGPKVVTAAEFNAATDNSIEYQVSGTISGIYQAYSSQYKNISLYISDETGEILAYRLSCEGISDPANTLTKGDLITVKGKRTLYDEKPQMAAGGVIVSHTDVVVETPAGGATLSFANKANRTVFTTSQQVWEQNGVKLINDKGSSTSNVADYAAPARFYKSSKLTVEYAGMTKIEFTCNNGSYATALKSSITKGTVTVVGSVVTVELGAAADSYVISSLTGGQVRMDSITVYAN